MDKNDFLIGHSLHIRRRYGHYSPLKTIETLNIKRQFVISPRNVTTNDDNATGTVSERVVSRDNAKVISTVVQLCHFTDKAILIPLENRIGRNTRVAIRFSTNQKVA